MWRISILALSAALVALACMGEKDVPDADGGVPDPTVDGDGDSDSDADADTDADADQDTGDDGWTDGGDREIEPPAPVVGVCFDGIEQDDESGLTDCEDLACLSAGACCQDVDRSWIDGDFEACEVPSTCGWSPFGISGEAVGVSEGWIVLRGSEGAEVGLYSEPLVEVGGAPILTLRAALDPETCLGSSCRQVVGIALSAQDAISAGTGVVPMVGLVLDGELEVVHLFISGRLDRDIPLSRGDLVRPLGYGLQIRPDGRVAIGVGFGDADVGDLPYLSVSRLGSQVGALRVVLFGRAEGAVAGRLGQVELRRPICDTPNGFQRHGAPVLRPVGGETRVGRPAVLRRPVFEDLLMIHESDSGLAAATSRDGVEWARVTGSFFTERPETQYSRVAQRAPTSVYWGPDVAAETYHLWFEGESEFLGEAVDGSPTNAIVHATSSEGLRWTVAPSDAIALVGTLDFPWRTEVGEPSVVVLEDGTLEMFFVGRDPSTGVTRLGLAFSTDGKEWVVEDGPIEIIHDSDPFFDRDGVRHPMVVRRGSVLHLWYTGYSGARSSIGCAVGTRTNGPQWSWFGLGPVFEATEVWEASRVSGPAVLTLPAELGDPFSGAEVGWLVMWYTAGRRGSERLGMAAREIPTRLEDLGL